MSKNCRRILLQDAPLGAAVKAPYGEACLRRIVRGSMQLAVDCIDPSRRHTERMYTPRGRLPVLTSAPLGSDLSRRHTERMYTQGGACPC